MFYSSDKTSFKLASACMKKEKRKYLVHKAHQHHGMSSEPQLNHKNTLKRIYGVVVRRTFMLSFFI